MGWTGILVGVAAFLSTLFCAEVYRDIPYYPAGEAPDPEKNLLDVYVPEGACGLPVFFWIHGGAWMSGDKDDYVALGENIADQEGLVAVIISYRLSDPSHPGVMHPDHIVDVARAFAWTKEHISCYGGDPDKIFVCGHSAGGHLCALLFTNTAYLEAEGLSALDICGAAPISIAAYDLWTYASAGTLISLYQPAFGNDTAVWRDASPKYHLHPGMPPTRIFVAQHDAPAIQMESENFLNDMNAFQPTETVYVEGGHISEVYDLISDPDSRIRRELVGFIREVAGVAEVGSRSSGVFVRSDPFGRRFEFDVPGGSEVEVFDLGGRSVFRARAPAHKTTIAWRPEDSLPTGAYFLIVAPADGAPGFFKLLRLK